MCAKENQGLLSNLHSNTAAETTSSAKCRTQTAMDEQTSFKDVVIRLLIPLIL